MEKICKRKELYKQCVEPRDTLKFEIWPTGDILVFGLNPEPNDYVIFKSWQAATDFISANYKMP